MKVLQHIQRKEFDLQIWFVAAVAASGRTLISVVNDLRDDVFSLSELLIDTTLLLMFVMIALLIYRNVVSRIHPMFSFVLLLLVGISFIQFGGVKGTTDYNLLAIGIFLMLVLSKKWTYIGMSAFFLITLVALIDIHIHGILSQWFFITIGNSKGEFFFTLATLLLLVVYFKYSLITESTRLINLKEELSSQNEEIQLQNEELEAQQEELKVTNLHLDQEINQKTIKLIQQINAIKDYIKLSSESLNLPVTALSTKSKQLNLNSKFEKKLQDSIQELHEVISHQQLDLRTNDSK